MDCKVLLKKNAIAKEFGSWQCFWQAVCNFIYLNFYTNFWLSIFDFCNIRNSRHQPKLYINICRVKLILHWKPVKETQIRPYLSSIVENTMRRPSERDPWSKYPNSRECTDQKSAAGLVKMVIYTNIIIQPVHKYQ